MQLSEDKQREYVSRLLKSRMRILLKNGFYGLLLMHMQFALDPDCDTAATDGMRIYFGPAFLEKLTDSELDFILMHEILHVVLQHCMRTGKRDDFMFNVACDIVVNSNIMKSNNDDVKSITLHEFGESMHTAPDGKEGSEYSAEQVYDLLRVKYPMNGNDSLMADADSSGKGTWDDHSHWGDVDDPSLSDVWRKRLLDAGEAISIRDPSNERGMIPLCARRLIDELRNPQTDWRTILNEFVKEEITDYSFNPPDRRFDDSPFFLPDYNEKEDRAEDILFMIDTSGSMSDDMITTCFSEVKGAIDQFGGKLKGWLGFFDASVVEPVPFESVEEFKGFKPKGGGGTDFGVIFKYVRDFMSEQLPAFIIILTDGYAPFPKESAAMGIPVLWLIVGDGVTPPWGKVARVSARKSK